jgi:hypothetical protein
MVGTGPGHRFEYEKVEQRRCSEDYPDVSVVVQYENIHITFV